MEPTIAVDAMGGDRAPSEVVKGVVRAARETDDLRVLLVGIESVVREELEAQQWSGDNIEVVPAEDVIEMGDSPVVALRKKRDSSISVAVRHVREGAAHAFVSAGNTGACVAAAQLGLGLLPGVKKAGILVTIFVGDRPVCIIDAGANLSPKPLHLFQYGVMGSIYSAQIIEIEEPRVGLINIGGEDAKGNRLVKATRNLFEESDIPFHGFVEGNELFSGQVDVISCDGFTGNVVLKVSEGLAERLVSVFQGVLKSSLRETDREGSAEGASPSGDGQSRHEVIVDLWRRSLANLKQKLDYSEYGGAPLLGVQGVVIIAHGRSDANAICNAVGVAKRMIDRNINRHILERI